MKQEDIKGLSVEDLKESLLDFEEKLTKLKISHAVSPLENPMQIRVARRTVAQIKTELRKRELQNQE